MSGLKTKKITKRRIKTLKTKELEDVTSDAVVKEEHQLPEENEEEEEEEKQGVNVSEPCDISTTNTFMSKEEAAEVKWSSKTGFFWKSKFTALLLLLVVAFLSVSVIHSPAIDSSVLKDLSFLKEYDHSDKGMERKYEFDVVDIEALGENGRTEIGAAENTVEVYADPEYDEKVNGEAETPVEIQVVEEKGQPEIGAVESTVEVVRVDPEHEEQVDQEAEAAVNTEEVSEGNNNFISGEVVLQAAHADLVDTIISGIQELESEMSTGAEVESFKDHSPISSKVDASCENVQTSEEVDLAVDETEFKVSMVTMLGIALLVSAFTILLFLIICALFLQGEEEIVTPVRRSNRIRKQVTSP
ncbi:hypothetical protein GBA52_027485 [Prunus armeniaca]|nr:hypothetical protein GBA52_027485 [Prunus armeniaca]